MSKILLLTGGDSPERDISLQSGAAVAAALEKANHLVTSFDPAKTIPSNLLSAADLAFPVLHGAGGEDGELQQLLEQAAVSFVGSGSAASKLCFDKVSYRSFLQSHDIRVPIGQPVDFISFIKSDLIRMPYVLKPFDGGSSLDTFIIRDPSVEQNERAAEVFNRYPQMLLEELISGVEITVGVLGDRSLPVIEIIPPSDGEFDYENKYNGRTQELCPAVNIAWQLQAEAQALAVQIHQLTGCRDLSRTDMIIDPAGTIYVLETNTLPGMTNQSLFPKAAAADGIAMSELCDQLAQMAASRRTAVA